MVGSYWFVVLGTLYGVMFGLSIAEAGIVALAIFTYWTGYNILDLSSGLVDILLLVGFVLNLSLLPGTSLLHWLHILLRLEFSLVVIICGSAVVHELVFPFYNEGLVHQSLEVRKIKHAKSAPEMLIWSSKKSVNLPFFGGHIIKRIAGQMVEFIQVLTYCHASLNKGEKFALLDLHNSGGYMILA